MPNKKYILNLTDAEREALTNLVSSGQNKARRISRVGPMLLADRGYTDAQILP